ncbi:MAG: glycosyltransferase, partial [Dysgonamonadaceae bacterium]|nr:glycosyltransferase [Dysgonamonadaceae bacterium]
MFPIKISVIVPVYNVAKLLPRCIDSLLGQTLQDIEIILIDDASTDNSLEICRKYEAKYPARIRVIASPENRRQGGARNLGIEAATGEYIGFT